MPLRIKCSSGHTLIVPDDRAGRRLRCPRCQAEVVVPGEPAAVAANAVVATSASETARSVPDEPSPASAILASAKKTEIVKPRSESPRETSRAATRSVVKPKSRALPLPEPSPDSAEQPAAPPPVAPPVARPQVATPAAGPPPVAPPAAAAPPQVKIAAPPIKPASPPPKALVGDAAPRLSREPEPPSVRGEAQVAEPIQSVAPPVTAPPPPPVVRPAPAVLLKVPEVLQTPPTVKADPTPEARIASAPPEPSSVSPPTTPTPPAPPQSTEAPSTPAPPNPVLHIPKPTISVPATAVAEDEGLFDHLAALEFAPPPAAIRPVAAAANPEAARTLAVYQLAAALVGAALFSVAPAVWDLVEYLRIDGSPFVARWALLLFFIGVLQLAYAVYLFQLPDWSSVWVITVFALCGAALYAAVLGIVLMSAPDGVLVGPHGLQLADKLAGGKAALWCVAMVALLVMLALSTGSARRGRAARRRSACRRSRALGDLNAAQAAAPQLMPHISPSCLASLRAVSIASSSFTCTTSSMMSTFSTPGMNPAPMPWMVCRPGLSSWPLSLRDDRAVGRLDGDRS
jgi:hypothetical protein